MTRATRRLPCCAMLALLVVVPAAADDLRGLEWGVGSERVLAAGAGELVLEGKRRVVRHADLAGVPVTINYRFEDDRLWQIRYFSRARHDDPGAYIRDYTLVKDRLLEAFGEPDVDEVTWTDEQLRDQPKYHGQAVAVGHLSYATAWEAPEARVLMTLENESFRPVQQIIVTDPAALP